LIDRRKVETDEDTILYKVKKLEEEIDGTFINKIQNGELHEDDMIMKLRGREFWIGFTVFLVSMVILDKVLACFKF